MKRTKLTKEVNRWSKAIGTRESLKRLVARDVPPTTAEKLCSGRYPSEPREKLAKILLEEMAKDGLALAV